MADPPEAWAAAGFTVDDDGTCRIGEVRVRLVGRDHGKRILGWSLRGAPTGRSPTAASTGCPPPRRTRRRPSRPSTPNGATYIDHVVLLSPDLARTTAAIEALGVALRGERDSDTYGAPMRQHFFRLGEVILELIGSPDAAGEGDPGFFGLAHTVADLDAAAALLGEHLGDAKDAVQPGRRIATLRHRELGHVRGHRAHVARAGPRLTCSTTSSPTPSARCATPSRRPSSSARPSRSASRSTSSSATPPGRRRYGLPGEGLPPRVQADITLDWPTWAQTAYRSWYIGEPSDEAPRIEIEIVMRIQRLASMPDVKPVLAVLPETSPPIGTERLERSAPTIEIGFSSELEAEDWALEVSYEGSYELDEATLADGSILDDHFSSMGGWIASTLVRLGDLEARLPARRRGGLTWPTTCVLVEVADAVATVTLNRPEARNALEPRAAQGAADRAAASSTRATTWPPSCSPGPTPPSARASTSRSSPAAATRSRETGATGERRPSAADRALPRAWPSR